ncbi:protein EXPORTIN 1A [Trifolium repens]|nr:protein EXPORTIN 1A [Trifolium repens]
MELVSIEASFRMEMLHVNKLNIILVQILKHEWPARWRSFIPDLVSAAKTSETICENCMAILKVGFIFESPLLETLIKFFPAYRNPTLQCLTEVASNQFGSFYDV